MRYYIYLDRQLLRTLFAVLENINFNIEVIEFAEKKSYSNSNEINIDPCLENGKAQECFEENNEKRKCKNNNFNNEKLRVGYDKGIVYNIQTEKKYINISDITDMKNINFYHKLILNIERSNFSRDNLRLYIEEGVASQYNKEKSDLKENEGFFNINDTCIWYDKLKLDIDVNILIDFKSKIKVIGYLINNIDGKSEKLVKAIAIYIE